MSLEATTRVALLADEVSWNIKYGSDRAEAKIGFYTQNPGERDQWIELLRKAMRTSILVSENKEAEVVETVPVESMDNLEAQAQTTQGGGAAAGGAVAVAGAGAAAAAAAPAPAATVDTLIDFGGFDEPAKPAAADPASLNAWDAFATNDPFAAPAAAAAPAAGGSNPFGAVDDPFASSSSTGANPFGAAPVAPTPVSLFPFAVPQQQIQPQPQNLMMMGGAAPAAAQEPFPPARAKAGPPPPPKKSDDPFAELTSILETTHISKAAPRSNPFDDDAAPVAAAAAPAPTIVVNSETHPIAPTAHLGVPASSAPVGRPSVSAQKTPAQLAADLAFPMRVNPSERKSVHDSVTAKYHAAPVETVEISKDSSALDQLEKAKVSKNDLANLQKLDSTAVFFEL